MGRSLLEPVTAHDVADLIMTMTEQLKDLPPEESAKWLGIYRAQGIRGLADSLSHEMRGFEFRKTVWELLENAGWTPTIKQLFTPLSAEEILGSIKSVTSPDVIDVMPTEQRDNLRKTLYAEGIKGIKKLLISYIMQLGGSRYAAETLNKTMTPDFEAKLKAVLKPFTAQDIAEKTMVVTIPEVIPHLPPDVITRLRRATHGEGERGFAVLMDEIAEEYGVLDQRSELEEQLASRNFSAKVRAIPAYQEAVPITTPTPHADMSSWTPEQVIDHVLKILSVEHVNQLPGHEKRQYRNMLSQDEYVSSILTYLMITQNMPVEHADDVEKLLKGPNAMTMNVRKMAVLKQLDDDGEL